MKKKERSEFLLVPRGGSNVRPIRLRSGIIIFFFLVIAGGFAGYFIPFNSFSIDVVEQNKKKNLEEQNKKLSLAIRPVRRLLDNLSDEVQKLEVDKKAISEKLGIRENARKPLRRNKNKGAQSQDLNSLVLRVKRADSFFSGLYGVVSSNSASFDSIPLVRPISDNASVSGQYEKEKDPFTQTMKIHYGEDFVAQQGTPVLATAAGTVIKAENDRLWGKKVTIQHGSGFSTVYAHLGTIEVVSGKRVRKGDLVGTIGISGMTSGPHLHYEIWYRGSTINPEDLFFPEVDSIIKTASR